MFNILHLKSFYNSIQSKIYEIKDKRPVVNKSEKNRSFLYYKIRPQNYFLFDWEDFLN